MSESDERLDELGAFLRARRGELEPEDVGLRQGAPTRRVPGLRREEVARLAAISADYYTKLEQGRMAASASTLASLARALRLDSDQRAYLFELGGKSPAETGEAPSREPGKHHLERVLDLLDAPAMVTRRNFDILAWNPLAAALMIDFSEVPEPERNFVRLIFTHPVMRRRYPEWEDLARRTVSYLRMEAAEHRGEPDIADLVEELSDLSPDFRRLWEEHIVAIKRTGTRTFDHPGLGEVTLEWDTLTSTADPDRQLVVYTAEPGSPSETALRELAARIEEDGGTGPS